jgi:hypothetical protein
MGESEVQQQKYFSWVLLQTLLFSALVPSADEKDFFKLLICSRYFQKCILKQQVIAYREKSGYSIFTETQTLAALFALNSVF